MRYKLFILSAAVIALASCGGNSTENPTPENKDSLRDTTPQTAINEKAEQAFDLTVANLPSPFGTMDMISKTGMAFNKNLLNSFDNAKNYSTSKQKALNFGVYNVDMGYVVSYKQNQEVMKYMAVNSKLAEEIGAGAMFNDIASEAALNKTMENRDSLLALLNKAYDASDKYLRDNERLVSATHMLIGGWIESNYITLQLLNGAAKTKKNEILYDKVWQQRAVIEDIMKLIAAHNNDGEFNDLKESLTAVQTVFAEIKTMDDLTKERLLVMKDKVAVVRAMIIM